MVIKRLKFSIRIYLLYNVVFPKCTISEEGTPNIANQPYLLQGMCHYARRYAFTSNEAFALGGQCILQTSSLQRPLALPHVTQLKFVLIAHSLSLSTQQLFLGSVYANFIVGFCKP
jgi:hypothetical protein